MLPNRQSYLDYSGDTTKTKETYSKPNETNPPQSRNSYQKDVTNTQQSSQPKRSQSPKNKVFKKARRNSADYKINPDVIPRPRHVEDIYRNPTTKSLTYETNEETLPPFSTSYFNVKEINNSSPRFIRSSIVKLPLDQETINKSSLIFGLHVQPFSELIEGDSSIPQVEVNEDILRCSRCNTYINNKFEMKFVGNNKRVAVCNCCNYSIDLATGNIKVKPEYMAMDISSIPELSSPTIDFVAPTKFLPKHTFNPSYGVFIDVSQLSIDLGFASYVITIIIID
jgi:protein transport protein SEC24